MLTVYSGQGSIYDAYSISLMDFLRSKNDEQVTEDLFKRLNLKGDQKIQLRKILTKPHNTPFDAGDLAQIAKARLSMTIKSLITVENSGLGNCMYYAYSISLMYFLRVKNDAKITEDVFKKLNLKEEEKAQLRKVLAKGIDQPFDHADLKKVIEPILGSATRKLAADVIKESFLNKPFETELFVSANYGIEYLVKLALQGHHPEIAALIKNDFSDPALNTAEIYLDYFEQHTRVNILTEMKRFVEKNHQQELVAHFKNAWAKRKAELKLAGRLKSPTDVAFHQRIVLDTVINNFTVKFFTANQNHHLETYYNYLAKNFIWGTDTTLTALHRAIQGEHFTRDEEDRVNTSYDIEIPMYIHKDGVSPCQKADPAMIIDNIGNGHWNSKIPLSIFNPLSVKSAKSAKSDKTDKTDKTDKSVKSVKSDGKQRNITPEAIKHFKDKLNALGQKIDHLKTRRDQEPNPDKRKKLQSAITAAKTLKADLKRASKTYFAAPDEQSYRLFVKQSQDYIETARSTLEQHRGWKQVLGHIGLAIAGLGIFYLAALAINKYATGKNGFFRTASEKIIDDIKDHIPIIQPAG